MQTQSTAALSARWGVPSWYVRRWMKKGLLGRPTRTAHGWTVGPHVKPPWRDGRMILKWLDEKEGIQ